jgi:hypothetical protein
MDLSTAAATVSGSAVSSLPATVGSFAALFAASIGLSYFKRIKNMAKR